MATESAEPPSGEGERRSDPRAGAALRSLFAPYKRRALKAFGLGVVVWAPFGLGMAAGGSAEISLLGMVWLALAAPGLLLAWPLEPVADAIRQWAASNGLVEAAIAIGAVALNGLAYAAIAVVPWMIRDYRRARHPLPPPAA